LRLSVAADSCIRAAREAAASAAGAAGIAYAPFNALWLSPGGCCRRVEGGRFWYQLYLVGGTRFARLRLSKRAKAAGFSALVVTIDTAGGRHGGKRDLRKRLPRKLLSGNLRSKLPFVAQLLIKPRWLCRVFSLMAG